MASLWQLDEFAPPQMLGFIRNLPAPEPYIGTRWLPNQTVFDLSFEYLLGSGRRPVMAHIMGFDSEAPIAGRPGRAESVRGELPPIKRKRRIGEKTIIRFMAPRAGTPDVQDAIAQVYEDVADLVDSIQARVEWLRLQALSEDKVVYDEAGVIFEFDFGIDDELQIDLTTVQDGAGNDVSSDFTTTWDDVDNANPINDLRAICDRVQEKTGKRPTEFVASRKVRNLFNANKQIKALVFGSTPPGRDLTDAEVQSLMTQYDLPNIVGYDVVMDREKEDGTYETVRPLAPNKAFLVTPGFGAANKTLWGPTAESRVLFGTPLASAAPGIWAETYGTTEPPAEWTKAAAVAFPTMPGANEIAQIKVLADS